VAQRKHLCLHVLLCGLVEMAPRTEVFT